MASPRYTFDETSGELMPETRLTSSGAVETLMDDGTWSITQEAPGPRTWTNDTFNEFWTNPDAGGRFDPRQGDIFPITTAEDLVKWGFGNQSPDPTKGLTEWLPGTGMTLQQFQEASNSLPFRFTPEGAVYDQSARQNPLDYVGTPDWREKVWPLIIAAIATAGAAGLGQGAAAATAGEAGAGLGLGETATFAAADAANIGALTSSELAAAIQAGTIGEGSLLAAAGLAPEVGLSGAGYVGDVAATADLSGAFATPNLAIGEPLWPTEYLPTIEEGYTAGAGDVANISLGPELATAEMQSLASGDLASSLGINDMANFSSLNSTNSFDNGEMARVLDRAPIDTSGLPGSVPNSQTTTGQPGGSILPDTQAPAPVVNMDPKGGGWLDNVLSQATLDKIMKYGPLIPGVLGAVNQSGAGKDIASRISSIPESTRAVGESITQGFLNGTLNPADLAGIDKWERDSIAASRQFFARAGTSRSTQSLTSEAEIRKKAEEMRAQARQNLLTTGINALGISDKYEAAAIEAELQADRQMNQYVTNFLNAYGSWMRALPELTGQKKAA